MDLCHAISEKETNNKDCDVETGKKNTSEGEKTIHVVRCVSSKNFRWTNSTHTHTHKEWNKKYR